MNGDKDTRALRDRMVGALVLVAGALGMAAGAMYGGTAARQPSAEIAPVSAPKTPPVDRLDPPV